MKQIIQTLGAAAIAAAIGMTTFTAMAAPIATVGAQVSSNVEMAQYRQRSDEKPRWKKPQKRKNDRAERRQDRRGYWNGHRGYREARRGYRRHSDGYYYAPEVFKLFR